MSHPNLDRDPAKGRAKKHPKTNRQDDFAEHFDRQLRANKTAGHSHSHGHSRKNHISINHLLDFLLYRDLPEYHQNHQRPRRYSGNRPRVQKNKLFLHGMRFINVNYKFVVDHRKAYAPQQMDPNVPVDTPDILRIIVPKGNACPICLSEELVAPRMVTSCGHILCLTCLLSLLESEVPANMKKESKVIVEKYNDCPLCGSIIRKRDVKPVQIDNVDERFEVPKIGDEVVLTLMMRAAASIVPRTRWQEQPAGLDFPWASHADPEAGQYLRFFKGDFSYVAQMYEQERADLQRAWQHDRETYQDDGRFYKLALKAIDADMQEWATKFATESDADVAGQIPDRSDAEPGSNPTYYYFQTGFKSSCTYVLSPLDMKVLKTSFNLDYTQLPASVIAKVENIKYEELDSSTVVSKYKYLLHLPLGTSVGFLECNWQNNEYVSGELWETFKAALQKRSKTTSTKFKKEELNRRRALNEEERRAREYIDRQNNGDSAGESYYEPESWSFQALLASLVISDYHDLPVLSAGVQPSTSARSSSSGADAEDAIDARKLEKSVWGMQIPKSDTQNADGEEDSWDAEEMIRKAREEIARHEAETGGKKKKKKNKIVLLSS